MPKLHFTTKGAAEYLGLSNRSLEDMRIRGTGPRYYKIGSGPRSPVRYTLEDLDAWLEERHVRSTFEMQKLSHKRS